MTKKTAPSEGGKDGEGEKVTILVADILGNERYIVRFERGHPAMGFASGDTVAEALGTLVAHNLKELGINIETVTTQAEFDRRSAPKTA